jgi:hypothetical protein
MLWSLAADFLVVAHFAFTAFVIFGGFLTWRWPKLLLLHLPALAWGCYVELSSTICPLTPLENYLRHRGGEAGYQGGFLAHYLHGILYPEGLTPRIQCVLAGILAMLNVVAYLGLILRARRRDPAPRDPAR